MATLMDEYGTRLEQMVVVMSSRAVVNDRAEINVQTLVEQGYLIVDRKTIVLRPQEASVFARSDVDLYSDAPVVVLLVKRADALAHFAVIRESLDDAYGSYDSYSALRDATLLFPVRQVLERTVVIVKPEYTPEALATVMKCARDNDFVVVAQSERYLSAETPSLFGQNAAVAEYVQSDVCVVLVLEKVGAVDEWRLLMGPEDPEQARIWAPNTLRALLGTDTLRNAVHGSASHADAKREIGVLFPFPFENERTLAIVKPDLVAAGLLPSVIAVIQQNGFSVIIRDDAVHMTKVKAERFYASQAAEPHYDALCRDASAGPCSVLVLAKPGAVEAWRKLCGDGPLEKLCVQRPNCLRARYSVDDVCTGVHASASAVAAETEINFFFPQLLVPVTPNVQQIQDYMDSKTTMASGSGVAAAGTGAAAATGSDAKSLNDVLVEALTQLCRVKPVGADAVTWLANWLLANNPNKPLVQEPEVVVPVETVAETLDARTDVGDEIQIVWLVGSSGSGKTTQASSMAQQWGYEHISATDIVKAASEGRGSSYAETVSSYLTSQQGVPTHIVVKLLGQAMRDSGKNKFVVNNFPANLDQAFEFERQIAPPTAVLHVSVSEQCAVDRAAGSAAGGEAGVRRAYREYVDDVRPILDHYAAFDKMREINGEGETTQVFARVKKALS